MKKAFIAVCALAILVIAGVSCNKDNPKNQQCVCDVTVKTDGKVTSEQKGISMSDCVVGQHRVSQETINGVTTDTRIDCYAK